MPDIYTSIEENDTYVEWRFGGFLGNLQIEKRYYTGIKDSLIFINSGLDGFNFLYSSKRRIILPNSGNKLKIKFIYEYQPDPGSDAEMNFRLIFFTNNIVLKEFIGKVRPTIEAGSNVKAEKNNISTETYTYKIPPGANNIEVSFYSYDQEEIKDLNYSFNRNSDLVGAAYFALNRFDVSIDKKPLEKYIYNHEIPYSKAQIFEISKENSDSLIIDNDVRILGIGESVHGSGTFLVQSSSIIKKLITDGYDIVGFEASITDGIKLNDYIKGRRNDIKDILGNGVFNFYNDSVMIELFNELKAYNRMNNNKISVFGFDIPWMDETSNLTHAAENNFKVCEEEYFNAYLKNFYHKYYSYYVRDKLAFHVLMRHLRDQVMSENIFYLDSLLKKEKKMILMAHLGHLSKKRSTEPSVGYNLSERYGNQYAVIGMFTKEGTFFSNHFAGFSTNRITKAFPLSHPIGKSIEQLCSELGKNTFYMNHIKDMELLDRILYSRYIGAGYSVMQFAPINMRKELDMVWFTRTSEASRILTKKPD
ncbi:MAG: erythromycin esterase family protein [Bacteroidales bacterium]|nr:erythromycin esterase family protein [Bacteroidales bacterium]